MRFVLLAATLFVATSACASSREALREAYVPVFGDAVEAGKTHPPGTVAALFAQAGSATVLAEARANWEAFLNRYPPTMEFEDATQKRYVDAAIYELMRVYYLLGQRDDGDRLLKRVDPLQLR
jgi:hypothetical protein